MGDRLAAIYANRPLRHVFIGEERGGVVGRRDFTAMQLYEEGARLEHSQRYDQPPGVTRPQCVTAGAEQAARCKLATSHSLTRRGGFLRTTCCACFGFFFASKLQSKFGTTRDFLL